MNLMVYYHGLAIILIAAAVSYCFFTVSNYISIQRSINETLAKNFIDLCRIVDEINKRGSVDMVEEDYAKQEIIKMYTLPSEENKVMGVEAKILPFKGGDSD